jgi:hypothetical protein
VDSFSTPIKIPLLLDAIKLKQDALTFTFGCGVPFQKVRREAPSPVKAVKKF